MRAAARLTPLRPALAPLAPSLASAYPARAEMAPAAPSSETASIREALRAAGLRATPSRMAVLRLLQRATAPVSHSEVTDTLESAGFDRATLYRNLFDLARVGLARRSDLGDHVWRFELAAGNTSHQRNEHPHFVCAQCGSVECLDEVTVVLPRGAKGPRAVRERAVEVQLKGLCDRCS